MKLLIVSNPAHGQINNLLSITQELLLRGHEVHIVTGDRLANRVTKLGKSVNAPDRIFFHGLGTGESVHDLTALAHKLPDLFHARGRHAPGNIADYLLLICDHIKPDSDDYRDTVFKVRDLANDINPDMIIVDIFSPFAVDGIRLTKRPYICSSPGASGALVKEISPLKLPMPMSGSVGKPGAEKGFRMLANNFSHIAWYVRWCFTHPWAKARRTFRYEVLGLDPVEIFSDSAMTPVPGKIKENVACISYNVAGLDLYPAEAYDADVFFVGPCFPPLRANQTEGIDFDKAVQQAAALKGSQDASAASGAAPAQDAEADPVKDWLDEIHKAGGQVIYINLGSIFYYTLEEYNQLILALNDLHASHPDLKILLKVPALSEEVQPIPPASELPEYIRRETWILSIETVLEHPVVKIAVHHGGGNSFNEALFYGLPQFVLPQWGETYDIAAYVRAHQIGVTSDTSPKLVREDIAAKLDTLLQDYDKFKRNCNRWQLRTIQAGGTKIAADIIEKHARQVKELPLKA
ncbi:hypothetical protein OC846_003831 [Tilletia horrida]|uniref:UDP-glycosyltransferases domain-containing protein n=1 Tax=Tilletia horrida TaxID=155126 RepID=A0AAN6GPT9_9BASI|nr:hypothetical protein OC845_003895 [Tilletia horrida]KAK0550074.1 hypothetical protein OC846_003831 [Tilletia horrida]KAK0565092.1 hypothetical protein OC861_003952 [Tilletia horrida]